MEPPQATQQWIRDAQQGDREAFERLVTEHRGRLEAIVQRRLGGHLRQRIEVDDVVQETFLKAFQAISSFRDQGPDSFFHWLRGIAENLLLYWARQHQRTTLLQSEGRARQDDTSPSKRLRREERFERLQAATKLTWPKPKMLIVNFPHNPTTKVVDRAFFEKVVQFAQENQLLVVHDLAYADLVFDGYEAPSILQISGAKEIAVEFYTLSKSYSMPGWRVGFAVGNRRMINALTRLKSYFDYGMFQPIQIAAIIALNSKQKTVREIVETYQSRRDILVEGLNRAGWRVERPKATMFVWAEIPPAFKKMGSLEFSKFLLRESKVAVSPGIGFGACGEGYVRFALVENEHRIRQAVRGIRKMLQK